MNAQQIICVLGMHRSGTSPITRILNLLGVYLGPEEHLMKPQADNPKGFWEHQLFVDINDEILLRLGGSWYRPPTFSSDWETAPEFADLRQRARAFIQQDFAGVDLWGWKDPRTCLTLPFWQRLLPPMRYVICLRNPVDVARSLEQRNGLSFEEGVDLWLAHMKFALEHTSGQQRLFIFYEDVMNSCHHELRRLSRFLEAPELAEQAEIQNAVQEFIGEEFQHHRTSIIGTADEPQLTFPAKALYLVLRIYVSLRHDEPREHSEPDPILQAALDHFSHYSIKAQTDLSAYWLMAQRLVERDQAIELMRAQLTEKETELQSQYAFAEQSLQEARQLRTQLEERVRRQLAREQELQQLQTELNRLQHDLEIILRSKSWRITAPLRKLYAVLGRLNGIRRRSIRRLHGLRELWYRTVWESLSFRVLTPAAVEVGSQNPQEATRWTSPVQIEHQIKQTFFAHPPACVTYQFTMPPRTIFRSFIALMPEVWGRNPGGVEFSVAVSSVNSSRTVKCNWWIHPTNFSRHRRWMECRVDLRRFANQEVALTLNTAVPRGASADFAFAIWGDPAILSRKKLRDVWVICKSYLKLHGLRGILSRIRSGAESAGNPQSGASSEQSLVAAAGPVATTIPASSARSFLERTWKDKLKFFLSDPSAKLVFPSFSEPLISIVIPTFNKAEYLYQCLESVLAHTEIPFELIIVNDCSRDETPQLLKKLENVKCVQNENNSEFIRTCNKGATLAKGRYLLFLNNDVIVTPQWLSTLVATIERYPKCGAVQGKLIRPEGTLQEAGTIVWRDGSALGYGRDDDPFKPEYCYVREAYYCSAACLLVRAELFHKLGGFDELYIPAFYEDVDLCFGVRSLGYKVVLQPQVSVFHYEFGSRSFERAEALCKANQPKFAKKWAGELQSQYSYGEILRARDRREGKRILVMDDQIPAPHLGSGLPRAYKMLELLAELGFIITFVPLTIRTQHQPATHRLQQLGIEVFYGDTFSPEELLRDRAGYYDIVILSRPHNGAKFLSLARQYFPNARIIYDAEALFCMREFLKAQLEGRSLSEMEKQRMLKQELDIMKNADVVITVSESEREVILKHGGHQNVAVWGHTQDFYAPLTPFSKRRDLLFVGGFLHGHPPNTDAVLYFATKLFPRIREQLPECRFVIVGSQPPESVQKLASQHIVVTGYVEDLKEYYEQCRVFVVPLRFGAGISLKLIEAMSHGIPAVVSTVGATGLDLQDGREVLIAQSDEEFVHKVVQLYENERLWCTVQHAAQEYIRRYCSPQAMKGKLAEIYRLASNE